MLKHLLRLLAASTSLVALLLFANTSVAATTDNFVLPTVNQPELELVNLNVISPALELTSQSNNTLLQHLGCSCAVCIQGINQ
jgi:hypothetical protein